MKTILETIKQPEIQHGLAIITDLDVKKGREVFTYYIETKGILKDGKAYKITITEL